MKLTYLKANGRDGFARVDLATIIVVLAVLGGLGLRVVAGSKTDSDLATCMSNMRQLMNAWQNYAAEHGKFAESARQPFQADWCGSTQQNFTATISTKAQLWPYLKTGQVFLCPADAPATIANRGRPQVRTLRSYSMNRNFGLPIDPFFSQGFKQFRSWGDFGPMKPAETFVLIQEHIDSLNDGAFYVDMTSPRWVDYPAWNHELGGVLAFADSHVEHWKWNARTRVTILQAPVVSPGPPNDDVTRLQKHTTYRDRH